MRVLAYLMRNENVTPDSVERAISSVSEMEFGDSATLVDDDNYQYRRAFIHEQINLIKDR